MQLTQKETELLKDLKNQEKLCAEKYEKYSGEAADPQLKNLFSQIAGVERGHLNTLTQIENGSAPPAGGSGGTAQPTFTAAYSIADTEDKKHDCFLCSDLLTMEKTVKTKIKERVSRYVTTKTRRAPMILPIIMEV